MQVKRKTGSIEVIFALFCVAVLLISGISAATFSLKQKKEIKEEFKIVEKKEVINPKATDYYPDITQNKDENYIGNTGYEPWYYYVAGLVCTANGNLYFPARDIAIKARGVSIEIVRSYNTHNSNFSTGFGYGWTFNYNTYLLDKGGYVILVDGDGSMHNFTSIGGGNYTTPPGLHSRLKKYGDNTYTLWFKSGNTYNFNTAGYLANITDRNGNHLTFTYSGEQLTNIADSSGISLSFTYNPAGRIKDITDPLGRKISYQYDLNDNLINVTDARGSSTLYFYCGCPQGHHLIGQSDKLDRVITFEHILQPNDLTHTIKIGNSLYNKTLGSYPPPYIIYKIDYDLSNNIVRESKRGKRTIIEMNPAGKAIEVTDPMGLIIRYTWDSNNNLIMFTDKKQDQWSYQYDSLGNLIKRTDPVGNFYEFQWNNIVSDNQYISSCTQATNPRGHITTYDYDSRRNLNKTTNALGQNIHYEYDSHGYLTKTINARGYEATYSYDIHGFLMNETDATGNKTEYTYDAVGRRLIITDSLGNTLEKEYNNNDYLIKVTDPFGNEQHYLRDAGDFLIGIIDFDGNTTYYNNNFMGESESITDQTGNTSRYRYDRQGNLIETTDPEGNISRISYDDLGRPTAITDLYGNSQEFTYDPMGNIIAETNKNGYTSQNIYDSLNRIVRITNALGYTWLFYYDANGNIIKTIDPKGRNTTYSYDPLNRLINMTNPAGNQTFYTYDANGNMIYLTDANGNTITYTYNEVDRVIKVTDAMDFETSFEYDNIGNLIGITDANNHTRYYDHDDLGRVIKIIDPNGNETNYGYDKLGNIVNITDANNHKTTYDYDQMGRLSKITTPLGYETQYRYDSRGNLATRTDANGNSTNYQYDGINRLIKTSYPDGSSVDYSYDAAGNVIELKHNGGMNDITRYSYDPLGRRIFTSYDYGGSFVKTLYFSYDEVSNLINLTDPEGNITHYEYDSLDKLIKITDPFGDVTTYDQDAVGNRLQLVRANGVETIYEYDDNYRLLNLTNKDSGGGDISLFKYTYDSVGNVLTQEDEHAAVTNYEYDPLNRLIRVVEASTFDYEYDSVGNRITMEVDGIPQFYTYDDDDRLITDGFLTYSYDPVGNRISDYDGFSTINYTYDFENRLINVDLPGNEEVSYYYNPEGYRLRTQIVTGLRDGGTTNSVPAAGCIEDIIMELDDTGKRIAWYTHGAAIDEPISMFRDGSTYYYLHDRLGSITGLTDPLETIVSSYEYDPFGYVRSETGSVENPYRFTGREWNPEIELYFYRARMYDQHNGRFLSKDPVDPLFFGKSGEDPPETPGNWKNNYVYVNNNPINRVDPTGRWIINVRFKKCMYAVRGFNDALAEARGAMEEKRGQGVFKGLFPNEMKEAGNFWEPGKGPMVRSMTEFDTGTAQFGVVKYDESFYACTAVEFGEYINWQDRPDIFIAQWLIDALCNEKLGFWERHQVTKKITRTMVHETAHWVDDQGNGDDAPGEEGEQAEDGVFGNGGIGDNLGRKIIQKLKNCANPPPPAPTPSPVPQPAGSADDNPTGQPNDRPGTRTLPVGKPVETPVDWPPREPGNMPRSAHSPNWGGDPRWGPVPVYPGSERLYFLPWNDTGVGEPSNVHDEDFFNLGDHDLWVTVSNEGDYNVTTEVDFTLERWDVIEYEYTQGFEDPWIPDSNGDDAPPGWEVHHFGFLDTWLWGTYPHSGGHSAAIYTSDPMWQHYEEWLITDSFDFSQTTDLMMSFYYYAGVAITSTHLEVLASTDGSTDPGSFFHLEIIDPLFIGSYQYEEIDLSILEGKSDVHLAFLFFGDQSGFIEFDIDDIFIDGNTEGWVEIDSATNGPYDLDPDVWIESFFDVYYDTEGFYRATFSLDTPLRGIWNDDDSWNDEYQAEFTVIDDTTPPVISDISVTTIVGNIINISCTVTDNIGVDVVKLDVIGPPGFSPINATMIDEGNDNYYYQQTYNIPGTYYYYIWAEDLVDNNAKTGTFTFIIYDTTPPEITNVQDNPDPQLAGGEVNITCDVIDVVEVSTVKVNITYPDSSAINQTMANIEGTDTYYYNQIYIIPGIYNYSIWANDTSGNGITTGLMSFEIEPIFSVDGYCYYEGGSPVDPVNVNIINIDTNRKWQAITAGNYYSIVLLPGEDINASETLRFIAKDDTSYVNVTDHIITQGEIDTGGISIDLILDEYYLDLTDFPMYLAEDDNPIHTVNQLTGAAVAQMNLDYMWWNISVNPGGPPTWSNNNGWNQSNLYNYGQENNSNTSLPFMDATGMWHTIQTLDPEPYSEYGYNFGIYHDTDVDYMLSRICLWIDYPAGTKPGHPEHVPGAVPTFEDYSRWMSIRGIHTNTSAYPLPSALDVYGFWVNDPYPAGIGENTYKTSADWTGTYYRPINVVDDPYNGEYVAICEPPLPDEECDLTLVPSPEQWDPLDEPPRLKRGMTAFFLRQVSDDTVVRAAIDGVTDQLIPYDSDFESVFEQSYSGRPILVKNLVEEKGDYYAVPFTNVPTWQPIPRDSHEETEEEITLIVVLVDANDGHFKEASWVQEPVKYLPISETDALEIVFDKLIEMSINPDDLNAREIKADLIYRDLSPYYPDWRVIINELGLVFFVSQEGILS